MVWTGRRMIVWGGYEVAVEGTGALPVFDDGAAYDPATNAWASLPPAPSLGGRRPSAHGLARRC